MATLDVISLAEAKLALNIAAAAATYDTELASYISAVSLRLDELVGPIVRRTVSNEAHDGGGGVVFLRRRPVSSVTSAAERAGSTSTSLAAENYASPTGSDYLVDTGAGLLYRRSGGSDRAFAGGRQNIVVTYVAGRFADTAAVDPRYKQAAAMMLTHLWRREQGIGTSGHEGESAALVPAWAVPRAVKELLSDQLLGTAAAD